MTENLSITRRINVTGWETKRWIICMAWPCGTGKKRQPIRLETPTQNGEARVPIREAVTNEWDIWNKMGWTNTYSFFFLDSFNTDQASRSSRSEWMKKFFLCWVNIPSITNICKSICGKKNKIYDIKSWIYDTQTGNLPSFCESV